MFFSFAPVNVQAVQYRESEAPNRHTGTVSVYGYCICIEISMSTRKSQEKIVIDWKAVGRRVRELRGFDSKQSDIAEAIGVAQSHISAIEHGQREIGALILLRLSRHYRKSIEWLLTGTES
jgi:DNA-binding XRE family transcriptional regulator